MSGVLLLVLAACVEPMGTLDAGLADGGTDASARRDGGQDAFVPRADGGLDAAEPPDAGPDCRARCLDHARSCGAPEDVATTECARVCDASPTEEELACALRLSCAAGACTYPADLPCAILETESLPVTQCPEICRTAALRCGAPPEVADARCDEACPLVTRGEQLACLRDAPCEVLVCIEEAGHRPCGVDDGRPR